MACVPLKRLTLEVQGGCRARTERGALCQALKHTSNTALCMRKCQLLLKADPSIVNEHPKYYFVDVSLVHLQLLLLIIFEI